MSFHHHIISSQQQTLTQHKTVKKKNPGGQRVKVVIQQNNHSIELEIKTATQLLYTPHISKSTGKEGTYSVAWDD